MTYFMVESSAALLAFFLLGALIGCLLKGFFWPATARDGAIAAKPMVEPPRVQAPVLQKAAPAAAVPPPAVIPPRPAVPAAAVASSVTITPAAVKPAVLTPAAVVPPPVVARPAGVSPELSAAAAAASAATQVKPAPVADPATSVAAIAAAAAAAAAAVIRRDPPAAVVPPAGEVVRPAVLDDDLKRIKGIGPEIERRLNALGVARYAQLAGWTADDVQRFNSELGFDRRIQKENWIEQAAVLAKEGETMFSRRVDAKEVSSGADTWTPTAPRMVEQSAIAAATAAAASAALAPKPIVVKPAEVVASGAAAAPVVTPVVAAGDASVRARATAALTGGDAKGAARPADPASAAPTPASPALPAASGFSGGTGVAVAAAGAAAVAAAIAVPKSTGLWDDVPGSKGWDDLKLVRTIDTALEAQLKELGVRKYADIASWTLTDVARYAKILAAGDRIDRERWIDQARKLVGGSAVSGGAPGVAAATGAAAAAAAASSMGASASSLTASAIAEADLVGSRINKRIDGDDLTLIRGVGPAMQAKLYERGVTRFAQIAVMSEADILKLGVDLGIGDLAHREGWINQSKSLMPVTAAAALATPAAIVAKPVSPIQVQASPAQPVPVRPPTVAATPIAAAAPAAVAVASAAVGAAAAAVPDSKAAPQDLKLIKGIGVDLERGLNGMGVRRYADIARWTPADVDKFGTTLGIKGRIEREFWVQQAQILARGGETDFSRRIAGNVGALGTGAAIAGAAAAASAAVAKPVPVVPAPEVPTPAAPPKPVAPAAVVAATPSVVAAAPAAASVTSAKVVAADPPAGASGAGMTRIVKSSTVDDLKRIRGIGVVVEKKLHALGVVSYHQIAEWGAADIDRVSEALEFKGRVERENWIAQARILAGGGQTDFSRRVDRGEVDPTKA